MAEEKEEVVDKKLKKNKEKRRGKAEESTACSRER